MLVSGIASVISECLKQVYLSRFEHVALAVDLGASHDVLRSLGRH